MLIQRGRKRVINLVSIEHASHRNIFTAGFFDSTSKWKVKIVIVVAKNFLSLAQLVGVFVLTVKVAFTQVVVVLAT